MLSPSGRKKGGGADKTRKEDYGLELEANVRDLMSRLRSMRYRPAPVRQVLIPKDGQPGKYRPLGISNFEDKIVQMCMADILMAIYEPVFLDCSYGFRPGRSCHQAVYALHEIIHREPVTTVVDIDLKNYFGTIDHEWLMRMLSYKIRHRRFLRYVKPMLKAGVLTDGDLQVTDEGTPQGSIVSPILSNVVLHYVLDEWFMKIVRPRCKGQAWPIRYADDAIACFEYETDAKRYAAVLPKRLAKFGLAVHAQKSRIVPFSRREPSKRNGTFDFLEFIFYMKRSRHDRVICALKTSRVKFCSKLKRVNEWIRCARHRHPLGSIWRVFCSKLRDHIQYYGISHNGRSVGCFLYKALQIVFKWLNRRSQRKSYTWSGFNRYIAPILFLKSISFIRCFERCSE